jgi:outer membrane lipoprotein-sorting protein
MKKLLLLLVLLLIFTGCKSNSESQIEANNKENDIESIEPIKPMGSSVEEITKGLNEPLKEPNGETKELIGLTYDENEQRGLDVLETGDKGDFLSYTIIYTDYSEPIYEYCKHDEKGNMVAHGLKYFQNHKDGIGYHANYVFTSEGGAGGEANLYYTEDYEIVVQWEETPGSSEGIEYINGEPKYKIYGAFFEDLLNNLTNNYNAEVIYDNNGNPMYIKMLLQKDEKGNITFDGEKSYYYDENNLLIKSSEDMLNYQTSKMGQRVIVYEYYPSGKLFREIDYGLGSYQPSITVYFYDSLENCDALYLENGVNGIIENKVNVNVRKEPNTTSEILGKLTEYSFWFNYTKVYDGSDYQWLYGRVYDYDIDGYLEGWIAYNPKWETKLDLRDYISEDNFEYFEIGSSKWAAFIPYLNESPYCKIAYPDKKFITMNPATMWDDFFDGKFVSKY